MTPTGSGQSENPHENVGIGNPAVTVAVTIDKPETRELLRLWQAMDDAGRTNLLAVARGQLIEQ